MEAKPMASISEISWNDMFAGKPLPDSPARKAFREAVEAVAVPHEFDEVVVRFRTGSREIDARVLDRGERGEALSQLHDRGHSPMNS